ncbi:hypothetical protein GJ496_006459 [Pomphorhynchus laevis]|nr:hypothetical protein GJ496_006459 [Pomphorhynchus laevis]
MYQSEAQDINIPESFNIATDEVLISYLDKGLSECWDLVNTNIADVEEFIEALQEYPEVPEWMVGNVNMFKQLFEFKSTDEIRQSIEQTLTEYYDMIVIPHTILQQQLSLISSQHYSEYIPVGLLDVAPLSFDEEQTTYLKLHNRINMSCVCPQIRSLKAALDFHVESVEMLNAILEKYYDFMLHINTHIDRLISVYEFGLYHHVPGQQSDALNKYTFYNKSTEESADEPQNTEIDQDRVPDHLHRLFSLREIVSMSYRQKMTGKKYVQLHSRDKQFDVAMLSRNQNAPLTMESISESDEDDEDTCVSATFDFIEECSESEVNPFSDIIDLVGLYDNYKLLDIHSCIDMNMNASRRDIVDPVINAAKVAKKKSKLGSNLSSKTAIFHKSLQHSKMTLNNTLLTDTDNEINRETAFTDASNWRFETSKSREKKQVRINMLKRDLQVHINTASVLKQTLLDALEEKEKAKVMLDAVKHHLDVADDASEVNYKALEKHVQTEKKLLHKRQKLLFRLNSRYNALLSRLNTKRNLIYDTALKADRLNKAILTKRKRVKDNTKQVQSTINFGLEMKSEQLMLSQHFGDEEIKTKLQSLQEIPKTKILKGKKAIEKTIYRIRVRKQCVLSLHLNICF